MKNIIKKAFIFVFTLALLFICFAYAKANATEVTTSSEIQVLGAGLRTTGSVAIRFQASIGNYEAPSGRSIVKYGMLFAYGESESFLKGDTVNDLEVLSCEVTELDEDNIYYVSIANIPSEEYVQNV